MGFLLFTESAVFNPINYGLQAGDNIYVVAVGGGGGAGGVQFRPAQNSQSIATGGAGAASSFGEYVSAPGGAGGSGNVTSSGNLAGGSCSTFGWFPWLEGHPINTGKPRISAWVPQQFLNQALAHVTPGLTGFSYIGNTSSYRIQASQQTYVSQQTTSAINRSTVTSVATDYNEVPWATFSVGMIDYYPTITARSLSAGIPAAGTGRNWFNKSSGVTYGSIGYGVGGTSHAIQYNDSRYLYTTSGAAGSIVKKLITLADVSPIAVSVGGGGGGAGFEILNDSTITSAKNGNNGSTSAQAPSNGNQGSGAGGYAGVNPQNDGGGGVCGCVAIWF